MEIFLHNSLSNIVSMPCTLDRYFKWMLFVQGSTWFLTCTNNLLSSVIAWMSSHII